MKRRVIGGGKAAADALSAACERDGAQAASVRAPGNGTPVREEHTASSVALKPATGETFTVVETPVTAEERKQTAAVKTRQSRTAKASFVWTVVSMLYAIGSGVLLVERNWVVAPYSYIMAGMLILYAVVFIIVVALSAGNVRNGRRRVSSLKKVFGIFRSFTLAMFLIATAVSMTGVIAAHGFGLWQWIVIGVHSAVAIVQVALKIALLATTEVLRRIGKHYTVKVTSYVNGVAREKSLQSKIVSKLYKTEITGAVSGGKKTDAERAAKDADEPAADAEDGEEKAACGEGDGGAARVQSEETDRRAAAKQSRAGGDGRAAEKVRLDKNDIKTYVKNAVVRLDASACDGAEKGASASTAERPASSDEAEDGRAKNRSGGALRNAAEGVKKRMTQAAAKAAARKNPSSATDVRDIAESDGGCAEADAGAEAGKRRGHAAVTRRRH